MVASGHKFEVPTLRKTEEWATPPSIRYCVETVRTSLVVAPVSKSELAASLILGPGVPFGFVVGRPAFGVNTCVFPVSERTMVGEPTEGSGKPLGTCNDPTELELMATTPSPNLLLVTLMMSLTTLLTHLAGGVVTTPSSHRTINCGTLNLKGKESVPNLSKFDSFSMIVPRFAVAVGIAKT